MKYKCTNCGQIYSIKTDYCDCGNNSFETIIEASDGFDNYSSDDSYGYNQTAAYDNNFYETNNEYVQDENYDNENEDKKPFDIAVFLSAVSLVVAIIVFGVLMYKAFTKPVKNSNAPKEETKIEQEIPQIDSFWDNSYTPSQPKNSGQVSPQNTNNNKPQEVKKPTANNSGNNSSATNSSNNQKSQDDIKKQQEIQRQQAEIEKQKAELKKQQEAAKKQQVEAKKQQDELKKKQEQQKQQEIQKKQKELRKQQEEIEKQKAEIKRQQELQKKKVEEEKRIKDAKELNAYKSTMRNTLFANFPLFSVQGYGSAQISFSVSSDGKLLNRKFVSQSDNKSLNDAMYHMLMRTPVVQAPPDGYHGEEIIMKMDFNNGSYSFSFVK